MLDVGLSDPLYLSPGLVVGKDPSGQLLAVVREKGEPTKLLQSLLDRVVTLYQMEYIGDPFFYNNRWCCKLKEVGDDG